MFSYSWNQSDNCQVEISFFMKPISHLVSSCSVARKMDLNHTSTPSRSPQVQLVEMSIKEASEYQNKRVAELERQLNELREQLRMLQALFEKEKHKREALERLAKRTSSEMPADSSKPRGKTSPLPPSLRQLISEKISTGEMTWKEACKAYKCI
jgi:TolA-binding protein